MAAATSMELSDMVNSSIVERPATNFTKFHEFFAHCAPATQEFFPELSGNCDSDSDPGAARRPVSPRRHGGHGDFTEASGFSVPLRVLRGGEKKCSAGFQPAGGLVDTKRVIQAQMPARRRRYHFFSRPRRHTEQPNRRQNYGPLCSLECGSLLPPLFPWGCSGSEKAQASLRTPKATPQEGWKNARLQRILDLVVWRSQ